MPIKVRHADWSIDGVTAADLARRWGITPQAAHKRVAKSAAPQPILLISTTDDKGGVVKETKVWREYWGL